VKKAAVLMGSYNDWPLVKPAVDRLRSFGVPVEARVMSAHRTPEIVASFASMAAQNGFGVVIACAGKAAHLAGAVAAGTILPVIGLPLPSEHLDGLDALLSTVQMPAGIPVATVAIGGAENAALMAAQILALEDAALGVTVQSHRENLKNKALEKDALLQRELDA
jgi:5-(carboxyamino)imidazole ribonucleotide mutase